MYYAFCMAKWILQEFGIKVNCVSGFCDGALRDLPLEGVGCNEVQPRGRLSPTDLRGKL